MRVLKFVFGGFIALLLISVVLKALFFMTIAAVLGGGIFMARRAFLRKNGYQGRPHFHPMRHQMMQERWQKYQPSIESIDDLVQRQQQDFFAKPYAPRSFSYREADLI